MLSLETSRKTKRRGAVLVEFATVFPLLMVFCYAMVEISRVLMLQHTADTAAYEGARQAMIPGATMHDAIDAAQVLLDANGLRDVDVSVTPEVILESTPLVTVTVIVPVNQNAWLSFFSLGDRAITSSVTLFTERPPIVKLSGLPQLEQQQQGLLGGVTGLVDSLL